MAEVQICQVDVTLALLPNCGNHGNHRAHINHVNMNRTKDRGVGSVYRRATSRTALVRFPAEQNFTLLHSVQTGSEAHPASYTMGIRGNFPWGKAAGDEADLNLVPRSEMVELYLHSPMSSWHSD
jgi:hypothetical protein